MTLVGNLAYKISPFGFYENKLGHLKVSLVFFINLGMNRLSDIPFLLRMPSLEAKSDARINFEIDEWHLESSGAFQHGCRRECCDRRSTAQGMGHDS